MRWLFASISLFALGCIPMMPEVVGHTTNGRAIVQMPLQWSNAFLIEGQQPVLIDAGSAGDEARLDWMLASRGVRAEDLAAVVITHGHADHAGLGATLVRRAPGPVILGEGDIPFAQAGDHGELRSTSAFADVLKLIVPHAYPPFMPDIAVHDRIDLHQFGLAGEAIAMPGHTPGSLVVVLDGGIAFVGDQLRGGEFAGALHPEVAFEHYYQGDLQQNLRNIHTMLARGTEVFYVGHGGPVGRAQVIETFGMPNVGFFQDLVLQERGGIQPPNARSSSIATAMAR